MKKKKSYVRKHNLHKIPRHRTYTAGEMSKQLGVNINTAREWIKNGLPRIDGLSPYLVHGTDLIKFLTLKQSDRKQKLEAGQFYCMKCRNARYANIHTIAHTEQPNKIYSVTGKCEVCFTKVNRLCKSKNLSFFTNPQTQFTMQEMRISIPTYNGVNRNFKGEKNMTKFNKEYNPKNERIKRIYFEYLKEAKGRHKNTIRGIEKALRRFEKFTRYDDFENFSKIQAKDFKNHLLNEKAEQSKQAYSLSTLLHTFKPLQEFFRWLLENRKNLYYKAMDIDYFNLSEADRKIASLPQESYIATIDQMKKVISQMPIDTVIQRRDRTLLCFLFLTGIRDGALVSLRLKHYRKEEGLIYQSPDQVRTKNNKLIQTFLLPICKEWTDIFNEWINELQEVHLCGLEDPIFPKGKLDNEKETNSFIQNELSKEFWADASPVRRIIKEAFERCGIPPIKPHSIRKSLTGWAERHCSNAEQFKAFSQNLGHTSPLTTFSNYGKLDTRRQGEVLKQLGKPQESDNKQQAITMTLEDIQKLLAGQKA